MLKFYKKESNHFTDFIADKLDEMVVARKIIDVNSTSELPKSVNETDLPVLSDGRNLFFSEDEIKNYLDELHRDLKIGRKLQSDTCFIDPENPDECL